MIHVFPDLADIGIDYRWTGVVGITRDNFPHIGAIGERVFYAIGYGGRGVALTHLLGKYLARRITGDRSEEHTSKLQSLMRISYAVFCLKKKKITKYLRKKTPDTYKQNINLLT